MNCLPDDFAPVVTLVKSLGAELINWQSDLKLRHLHSVADFKTEADLRAHHFIVEKLSVLFPHIDIVSEEDSAHTADRPNEYWLIDPIDGTASWFHGFDGFVCQAAFMSQGQPVFGVIHAPRLGKTWVAKRGKSATLNGELLPRQINSDNRRFVDNTPQPHGVTRDLMRALNSKNYLESGSMGLKAALVADGTADIFVKDVIVRDWDLAPAHVILTETGCAISQLSGEPYAYEGGYEKLGGFVVARNEDLLNLVLHAHQATAKREASV